MIPLIPDDLSRYIEAHTSPEPEHLSALAQATRERTDSPSMQVGPVQGTFLKLLARAMGARRVLEIGTFTGYSALMLAEGAGPDGEVVTCDVDPRTTAIAREFWARSPMGKRITLRLGRALDTIAELDGPFDLVFIDADKANYVNYWEACVPKVRSGGVLLADNVLWSGRVLDPREKDDHALAAFNRHVRNDPRVDVVILSVRDGVTMACKR